MLPEGWQHTKLGHVFGSSRTKGKAGLPTLSVTLTNGLVPRDSIDRKMDTNLSAEEHLLVRKGDIAYNMMRMWQGASGLSPHDALVSPAYVVLRAKDVIDPLFAAYLFKLAHTVHQFWAYSYGITDDRLRLYFKDFGAIPANLPPLLEQRKIAEILSTWDTAIAAQERLIANAKRQKKALMQTLLPTGAHPPKKRLPGFSGDWRSVCLGDIGKLRKGKGIRRDQVRASGFPCVRYGEIYTQHHEQVRRFHSFIDAETAAESEPISAGEILFTCSGETAEEIGKCVAYLGSEKAYAGGDIIILSPTADNAAFLGYVLNGTDVAEQKRRFGQGNSVVHISAANLSKLTFKLPSCAEQDAIASVLDDATIHIDGLAAEHTTLIQEKSALMQQLLTGKRRVKLEEAA